MSSGDDNINYLGRESAEEGEPEVTEREGEVLVEEIPEELRHSQIRPTPMDEEQALQETELSEGEIAG